MIDIINNYGKNNRERMTWLDECVLIYAKLRIAKKYFLKSFWLIRLFISAPLKKKTIVWMLLWFCICSAKFCTEFSLDVWTNN